MKFNKKILKILMKSKTIYHCNNNFITMMTPIKMLKLIINYIMKKMKIYQATQKVMKKFH